MKSLHVLFVVLISLGALFFLQTVDASNIETKFSKRFLITTTVSNLLKSPITRKLLLGAAGASSFASTAYLSCWKRYYYDDQKYEYQDRYLAQPIEALLDKKQNLADAKTRKYIAHGIAALATHAGLISLSLWNPQNQALSLLLHSVTMPLATSASFSSALFFKHLLEKHVSENALELTGTKNNIMLYQSILVSSALGSVCLAKNRRLSNAIGQSLIPIIASNKNLYGLFF